jgi:hypothetical protein
MGNWASSNVCFIVRILCWTLSIIWGICILALSDTRHHSHLLPVSLFSFLLFFSLFCYSFIFQIRPLLSFTLVIPSSIPSPLSFPTLLPLFFHLFLFTFTFLPTRLLLLLRLLTVSLPNLCTTKQVDVISTLDFYVEGTWFESLSGYRLSI